MRNSSVFMPAFSQARSLLSRARRFLAARNGSTAVLTPLVTLVISPIAYTPTSVSHHPLHPPRDFKKNRCRGRFAIPTPVFSLPPPRIFGEGLLGAIFKHED